MINAVAHTIIVSASRVKIYLNLVYYFIYEEVATSLS